MKTKCEFCIKYENLGSLLNYLELKDSEFCLKAIKYIELLNECPKNDSNEEEGSIEDLEYYKRLEYGFKLMNASKQNE